MTIEWATRVRDLAARIEAENGRDGRHAEMVRMVDLLRETDPFDSDRAAMSLLNEVPAFGAAMQAAGRVVDAREHGVGARLAVYAATLERDEARGPLCEMFRLALDAVLEAKAEGRLGFEGFGAAAAARYSARSREGAAPPAP